MSWMSIEQVGSGWDRPSGGRPGPKSSRTRMRDDLEPRILIVEDELLVAWHLESILKDLDYAVSDIVPDGAGAMEQTEALGIDLILMDINLKGDIDGIETARRIRETSDAAIIFVTAYSDPKTLGRVEAAVPGATVLTKPVAGPRLRAAILKALEARDS